MSVEFRKRSLGDILKIVRRRGLLIALPAIVGLVAVLLVLPGLPKVYRSTTFLTLTPPTISEKVAPSLTDESMSHRLQSIGSNVLSRSSLEAIISKFDLYADKRAAGLPMETVVDGMRANIEVDPEKGDNEVVGFRISFKYNDAHTAQMVTAHLAERYITDQNKESRESAETTREFIDAQLAQAKTQLDAIEQERLGIMMRNVDTLPESSQGLIAQLTGLRQREQTIAKDKETLMTEQGRVHESIRALNSQIRLVDTYGDKDGQESVFRIEDTPAYAQLIQKRAELTAKLENLRKKFRDKEPEVVQTRTEIQKINDELGKLAGTTDQRARAVREAAARKSELQKKSLEIERDKAESQLKLIATQIENKDSELQQNSVQISMLESKINTIPNVKVELEGVSNEYASAKSNYDELLKKFNSAQQQVQRESNEQGETIRVVDPASLPETPENASKRPMFLGLGAGAGLFFGLLMASFFEVPRLFKIQDIVDTEHYTGLPVLAAVPPLLTETEMAGNKRLSYMKVVGGIIIAVIAVPALVLLLNATKILERLS